MTQECRGNQWDLGYVVCNQHFVIKIYASM